MTDNTIKSGVSRRGFLAGTGGLTLAFMLAPGMVPKASAQAGPASFGAFVDISTSGAIRIYAPAAEMGQGIQTGIPMLIAEEMDADWSDVVVETAPVDAAFNNPIFGGQYTVASLSTKGYWNPARMAGAQARRVLIDAAAAHWGIPSDGIVTQPSRVVAPDGQSLSYGEIAAFATAPDTMPEITPEDLKPAADYRILGHGVPRVDIAAKVDGSAKFAIDARVPGMVHATVARAPASGQTPGAFNADEVRAMPGVIDVIALGSGVGVVADTIPHAFAARRALQITWEGTPPGAAIDSAADMQSYLAHLREDGRKGDVVFSEQGDAMAGLEAAATTVTREFTSEYAYHAQMEPMTCTADVRADGADIWVGTQWQTLSLTKAAAITGLDPSAITVHQHYIGGGFGRRAHTEYVDDAVALSKAIGRPVKMTLSREDDVAAARMRPMTAQRVTMGLDAEGQIVALRHMVACEPVAPYMYGPERWEGGNKKDIIAMRGANLPHYAVPDQVSEHVFEYRGARVAAWRGIGEGYTKFALEAMVDQIAHDHGKDPLDYRLGMVTSDRARAVLERVRTMSDWDAGAAEGRAKGVAFSEYGDSFGAAVAEISVDESSGSIRVHNMWAAVDPGLPMNPDTVAAQVEGALVFCTSAALMEQVTVTDGAVQQRNYGDYPVLRMDEVPEIMVEVIRGSDIPTEVGELGTPLPAPAIANAFLALTGKPLNQLPMSRDYVRSVLQA